MSKMKFLIPTSSIALYVSILYTIFTISANGESHVCSCSDATSGIFFFTKSNPSVNAVGSIIKTQSLLTSSTTSEASSAVRYIAAAPSLLCFAVVPIVSSNRKFKKKKCITYQRVVDVIQTLLNIGQIILLCSRFPTCSLNKDYNPKENL